MTDARDYRIWLLSLVPTRPKGRWWSALCILAFGAIIYGIAAWRSAGNGLAGGDFSAPVAAFFVAAVAYVIPVFHYITERTREGLDQLAPRVTADLLAKTRRSLTHKPLHWMVRNALVAVTLWLLQSWLLAGGWRNMLDTVSEGYVAIVMAFGPLPVWLVLTAATRALIENAFSFRRIAGDVRADVFCPPSFVPVGAMAVTSTLFVLGALALLPIMWLGGPISWWTTLPALVMLLPTVLALLLLPVWPLHRELLRQRREAIRRAQAVIDDARRSSEGGMSGADLVNALALRREVLRLSVWPFDIGELTRLLAYGIIVPSTWAGAALIEMLVNLLVDG
jgi:hypothetical protein